MIFTTSRSDIYHCIQQVSGVVPSKTTLPILNNLLLSAEEGLLKISATDLEISMETSTPVTIEEEGAVAIPSKMLGDILRELPDIPLTLTSDEETQRVTITTDIGTYKISGEPEDEFPNLPLMEEVEEINIHTNLLKRIIGKTVFAASQDELRPALVGILMEIYPEEVRAVSTDGHRLVKIVHNDFSCNYEGKVIVPTKALILVQKNLTDTEKVIIKIGESHISFQFDDTIIYSRLINEHYPDYERVIPQSNEKTIQMNHDFFNSAVKRVSIFSNPATHQIKLSFSKNQVEISSQDVDFGGEAREVINAEYNDDEVEIGYNANYILDILRHIDTEEVILRFNSPTSAGIIYPAEQIENEDLMMLAMPVRLNGR